MSASALTIIIIISTTIIRVITAVPSPNQKRALPLPEFRINVSTVLKPGSDELERSLSLPTFLIDPPSGWPTLGLRELWEYRELLYFFTWRDIKVRYKQTALGAAWAIIQPFFMMVVFSLFFGKLGGMKSDGLPYPVFVFCALLPWQLFAFALSESSNSLVGNQNLITKVYFPRLVVPISAVLGGLLDFVIAFVILLAMMAYYGIVPGLAILTLPLFILLAVLTALGVGLWLSA